MVSYREDIAPPARGFKYSAPLDGLRALAALTIVLYHAGLPGLPGGFFGVDVFFVLSGYLITSLLIKELSFKGKVEYRTFLVRRLRRLVPASWLFLVVYVVFAPVAFPHAEPEKHISDAVFSALYLVNYASVYVAPVADLGHMWSLAVEMQFYLLWPLVLVCVLKTFKSAAPWALLSLYILSTAGRWWAADVLPEAWDVYVRSHTHCSGLVLGGLLGVLQKRVHSCWSWVGFLLLVFSMTFYSSHWIESVRYGFTVAELGAAMLVLSQPAWLGNRFFVWLGTLSYGLYLWHYPFVRFLREQDLPWVYVLMAGLSLGLICAYLSYHLIEKRFYKRAVKRSNE